MNIQHKVSSNFIIESLETFWDMRDKYQPEWFRDASRSLKGELLDMIEQCGLGEEATPSSVIDNFLINGDFVDRTETDYKNDLDSWLEYCNDNALIHNEHYACLRF